MTWSSDKYFAKAQLYWARANALERDDEEYLLHVAFACEFLIRGAVSRVNPALNAAPESESLLYASGVDPLKPPRTVLLSDGLKRLHRCLPTLTEQELATVSTLMDTRNRELHDDDAALSQLTAKAVMPSVYSFVVKVVDNAGVGLADILGEDARQAEELANAMAKDRKKRVGDLIRICKDRFFSKDEKEQEALRKQSHNEIFSAVMKSGKHLRKEKCPSCASPGFIVGFPIGQSAPILKEDGIIREIRVAPTEFVCKVCTLNIQGLDELIAAGFAHEFNTIDEVDPIDHLAIDPMQYVDIDEVVREYHREEYEYQDE